MLSHSDLLSIVIQSFHGLCGSMSKSLLVSLTNVKLNHLGDLLFSLPLLSLSLFLSFNMGCLRLTLFIAVNPKWGKYVYLIVFICKIVYGVIFFS